MKNFFVLSFFKMLAFGLLLFIFAGCKKNDFAYLLPNGRPIIGLLSESFILHNGAAFNLDIEGQGDSPITQIGICWGVQPMPTTQSSNVIFNTNNTSYQDAPITGLVPLTTYYVRAFATNSLGTSYSNEVTITTRELVNPPCSPTNRYMTIGSTAVSLGASQVINQLSAGFMYGFYASSSSGTSDVYIRFNDIPVSGKYVIRAQNAATTPNSCIVETSLFNAPYGAVGGDTVYVVNSARNRYTMTICNARFTRTGNSTTFRLTSKISN